MVLKQINNENNIFSFKALVRDKNYNEYTIYFYNKIGILCYDLKNIEKVYFDDIDNTRLFIKFKNENILKVFSILELDLI